MKKFARYPVFGRANPLHALTEQDVAEGSKQNHEQNKYVSFQVQARRIFHAISASPLAMFFKRVRPAVESGRVGFSIGCRRASLSDESQNSLYDLCIARISSYSMSNRDKSPIKAAT